MNEFDKFFRRNDLGFAQVAAPSLVKGLVSIASNIFSSSKAKKELSKKLKEEQAKLGPVKQFPGTPKGVMEKYDLAPSQFYSLPVYTQTMMFHFALHGSNRPSRLERLVSAIMLARTVAPANVPGSLSKKGAFPKNAQGAAKKYWLTAQQINALTPADKSFVIQMASQPTFNKTANYERLVRILTALRQKVPNPPLPGAPAKAPPVRPPVSASQVQSLKNLENKVVQGEVAKKTTQQVGNSPEFINAIQALKAKGYTDEQAARLWFASDAFKQQALPVAAKAVGPQAASTVVKETQASAGKGPNMAMLLPVALLALAR